MAFENFDYETIREVSIKSLLFLCLGGVLLLLASGGELEQSDFKWLAIGGAGLLLSSLFFLLRFFLDQGWFGRLTISAILAGVVSFSYFGLQNYFTEADAEQAESLGLEWIVDPRSKFKNPFRYRSMTVNDIAVSADGNVFFAATLRVGHSDDFRMLVGKISSDGEILWKKRLKAIDYSNIYESLDVVETRPNGGAFVGGDNGFVARVDKDGKIVWQRNFGMSANTDINDIMILEDGRAFIAGDGSESCWECDKAYIALLSADGDLLWEKQMDTNGRNTFESLSLNPDGSILAVGSVEHPEKGSQGRAVKINLNGEKLAEQSIDKLNYDAAITSFVTVEGATLVATTIKSVNSGSKSDMGLYTLNKDMTNFKLQRYFGPRTGSNEIDAINQLENGDIVLAGSSMQGDESNNGITATIFNTNVERSDSWSNQITDEWGSRVNDIAILPDGSQVFTVVSVYSGETRIARRPSHADLSRPSHNNHAQILNSKE